MCLVCPFVIHLFYFDWDLCHFFSFVPSYCFLKRGQCGGFVCVCVSDLTLLKRLRKLVVRGMLGRVLVNLKKGEGVE
jgi:hypothetical protein